MNIVKVIEDLLTGFLTKGMLGDMTTDKDALGGALTGKADLGTGYNAAEEEAAQRLAIVRYARSKIGTPYKLGAEVAPGHESEASLLDCSELVEAAYRVAGLTIPDGCIYQQQFCQKVPNPEPGDLIFLGPNAKGTRHVLIVSGIGCVIHAKGGVGVIEEDAVKYVINPRFQGYFRHPDFQRKREDRI